MTKAKKLISLILTILMIFSTTSVAFAANDITSGVSVKIISFMRGEQTNLRSSELLEAHVTGYDGNVQELTYKWTSSLGTYLYVYNSHNMYGINNTDGEIEIHNTDKNIKGLSNMVGRTYNKTFSGVGYAWASVYGASISNSTTALVGTVTVEVYDTNNKLLCSNSHEGKYANKKYSGFVLYDLDGDMDNVVLGLFEGDKRNVKDLLGESAVVHITCVESTVESGKIVSGSEHIELKKESDGDYYITGTNAGTSTDSKGDALVDLTIKKGNCKFHNGKSGNAETTVFVFKKPTTSTTTTTLTLTGNLDDRCDYFIGGVQGTVQSDGTIIFTGLTPNTAYTVEVRGEYKDNNETTKYAYAYVYDTTKPVYKATVKTLLDGVLTDISDIHGEDVNLFLHEDKENSEYIALTKEGKGTYAATVENGIYFPWHIEAGDHYHQAREYKLIVENANAELELNHYSATYYVDEKAYNEGNVFKKDVFSSGASVTATSELPERDGYVFAGWKYDDALYNANTEVTSYITSPITLIAQWEKEVNVTINVTINHKVDGGFDTNNNKDELLIEFLEMKKDSPAFVETGDKLFFSKEGVTDENGNTKPITYTPEKKGNEVLISHYTATAPTYTGLLESSFFGVAVSKSGYDVGEIEKIQDENGNWTINVPLTYNPDDFDIEFSVKMADDVPQELYPDAVIVKIACWNSDLNEWVIITQQRTTELTVRPGVRVDINKETGIGSGSYPVWKRKADGSVYGYRAVVTGFIYKDSTIVVPTEKDHTKADGSVTITYTDGNYTATMGNVSDGKQFSTSLYGAYYNNITDDQQGTLDAVITLEKYDVTFDAQGGIIRDQAVYTAKDQYYIPVFAGYQPTMEDHNFLGWYLDKECTIPAVDRVLLTEDVTVYAKWDRVLTGNLIVDGYFTDEENVQHIVNDTDRAKTALIELVEITNDGEYNIAGSRVDIEWTEGKHFSDPANYKFTGLSPDKTYRINVYLMNYDAAYQNPLTVRSDDNDDHNDYYDEDATDVNGNKYEYYKAVYAENELETYVNAFLHFVPETYFQPVEIDATRIGEGFRPENALVEYYAKELGTDRDFGIITQHTVAPKGVQVGIDTKAGTNDKVYGDDVWKKNYTGNLYDYQANLTKLNGVSPENYPIIVTYGDSARWSPLNQAPTSSLVVTLIPRWYNVIYDYNGGTDDFGNDKIVDTRGHLWSHTTVLDGTIIPYRTGYDFLGWYTADGESITTIDASVASDTTVYAKWEARNNLELTVKHILITETGNHLYEEEIKKNQTFGTTVTANSLIKTDIKGYEYTSASSENITIKIDSSQNEISLYYSPVMCEYTVFYLEKGSNGTVLHEPKTVNNVPFGSEVTETAIPITGYNVFSDINNPSTHTIKIDTEGNYITFYYIVNSYDYTVNYLELGTGKVLADPVTRSQTYGKKVTAEAKAITGYTLYSPEYQTITINEEKNEINFYYTVNSYPYTINFLEIGTNTVLATPVTGISDYGKTVIAHAKFIDDYTLVGSDRVNMIISTVDNVVNFYYEADTFGGGKDGEEPDNIPDKYQKKVIFKVVNGTWSDGSIDDIITFVELKNDKGEYDIDGVAPITAPTDMKPDATFEYGVWDKDPDEWVFGTSTITYTYTFAKLATPIDPIEQTDVNYVIEYYKSNNSGGYTRVDDDTEILSGKVGETVTATAKEYDGYTFNEEKSTLSGVLKSIATASDVVILKLYYDKTPVIDGGDTDTPDGGGDVDTPDDSGSGNINMTHHVLFGKTDGIGWYKVSKDGGQTFDTVFGNSLYEVDNGTQIIVKVGDIMGDAFTFYVNGQAIQPDENGNLVITVNGYMLIGALGYRIDVPDVEESLNWFQKLIKAIKEFFAKLFGKKK